jgi:hypothetical protein
MAAQPPRKRLGLLRGGGQRLVSRAVLKAPLELVRRRRYCPPGMANDPYDLPDASALTAFGRRTAGGDQALAVSTAALADPVCDSWHGWQTTGSLRQPIQPTSQSADASSNTAAPELLRPAQAKRLPRTPIFRRISSHIKDACGGRPTAGAGFPDAPADARVSLGFPAPKMKKV